MTYYGRRNYRGPRRGITRSTNRTNTTRTRQTARVLKTKSARARTVSNARAIDRVKKQVRIVRSLTYGAYQQSHQVLESPIVPTKEYPCLINLSNCQINARVWQPVPPPGGTLPGSTPATPVTTQVNKFVRPPYAHTGFWSGAQDDVVNGKHKLLSSRYVFETTFTRHTVSQTIRIDCFIVKRTLIMSLKQHKQLPNSLYQLHSMATSDNRFNPQYFKRIGKQIGRAHV